MGAGNKNQWWLVAALIIIGVAGFIFYEHSQPFRVSCVIRNDGEKWFVLDDVDHRPLNCHSIYLGTDNSGREFLILNYGAEARYVHDLSVSADETFVGRFHAGASVGLADSSIYFTDANGSYVSPVSVYDPRGNFFVRGLLSR